MSSIAVIGAGLAGLAAAQQLSDRHDVTVFEAADIAGGKVRSERINGYLFEHGPAGFLSNAADLRALVTEIGLDDVLVEAAPAAKNRFIYWDGALHKLPAKPPQFFGMSLLSPLGKLRAVAELVVPRRVQHEGADDESVYAFMRRRFGREVAERIVAPALLGVSGGDAATTSLAAVFPRVFDFERDNGSVIRGMMRGARTPARFTSFADGGMQRLTDRLAGNLGARLRTATPVAGVTHAGDRWRVAYAGGEAVVDGVIVATPAGVAATLVSGFDLELATQLRAIAYAPMRAIGVAFRAGDVPVALDGFGFLAARAGGVRILGAVYTSTIMPDQAPPATAYLRIFMGGATDPEAVSLDEAQAREIVLRDLATVLGIRAEPVAYHDVVWPQAIPQYALRHRRVLRAIDALTATHPGIALTGNAYRGLGVGDVVRDARAVAAQF